MYLHNSLLELGFKLTEFHRLGDTENGYLFYKKVTKNLKVGITNHLNGKIVMSYYFDKNPREIEFSILYMNNEEFIIKYIKDFLKKYK